jgi:hypothetical protein
MQVCSLVSRLAAISGLVLFGAREVGFLDLGFPGLDRSDLLLYRPDQCRSLFMEIVKSFSGDPTWGTG